MDQIKATDTELDPKLEPSPVRVSICDFLESSFSFRVTSSGIGNI